MLIMSAILDCQFVFDRLKGESCVGVFFDFSLLEKLDQRNRIKFCLKNEIKCVMTFEMWTVALGITG